MLGYFRKDLDGHNYFIPVERVVNFDELKRMIEDCDEESDTWYELQSKFDGDFGEYLCYSPTVYLAEISVEQLKN